MFTNRYAAAGLGLVAAATLLFSAFSLGLSASRPRACRIAKISYEQACIDRVPQNYCAEMGEVWGGHLFGEDCSSSY
jgi:hypothetical protein